jgi:protein gp37
MTGIEWTDKVWNPTTGCDRVSPGCDHCYALSMAKRLKGMGDPKYQYDGNPQTSGPGFGLSVHPAALDHPLKWRKPNRVFVNSMSDLFHSDVPDEFIAQVWAVMALASQHTFQILTKRHARMRSLLRSDRFPDLVDLALRERMMAGTISEKECSSAPQLQAGPLPNVWLGVSVEDQQRADLRVPHLLATPAAVRFLSCEPLLGPVSLAKWLPDLDADRERLCQAHRKWLVDAEARPHVCTGLDWVITGGESGHGARPMHPLWARTLRDQCVAAGVAFHHKQNGAHQVVDPDVWQNRRQSDVLVRADGYSWPLVEPHGAEDGTEVVMRKVNGRTSGRQLDGREWDEYPVTS